MRNQGNDCDLDHRMHTLHQTSQRYRDNYIMEAPIARPNRRNFILGVIGTSITVGTGVLTESVSLAAADPRASADVAALQQLISLVAPLRQRTTATRLSDKLITDLRQPSSRNRKTGNRSLITAEDHPPPEGGEPAPEFNPSNQDEKGAGGAPGEQPPDQNPSSQGAHGSNAGVGGSSAGDQAWTPEQQEALTMLITGVLDFFDVPGWVADVVQMGSDNSYAYPASYGGGGTAGAGDSGGGEGNGGGPGGGGGPAPVGPPNGQTHQRPMPQSPKTNPEGCQPDCR